MKNLSVFLIITCLAQVAFGQVTHNHSLAAGFVNKPGALFPVKGNRWVVAGVGAPSWGGTGADTVFFVVLDATGRTIRKQTVPVPGGEAQSVHEGIALPDGGFVLASEARQCDVLGEPAVLSRFDAAGELLWQMDVGPFEYSIAPNLSVAPDGNLLHNGSRDILKIGVSDGLVQWRTEQPGENWWDSGIIALIPGSEDFIHWKHDTLEFWRQVPGTGFPPEYVLADVFSDTLLSQLFIRQIAPQPDGYIFMCSKWWVYKITPDFQLQRLPFGFNGIESMAVAPDGLVVYSRAFGKNRLAKLDFEGKLLKSFTMPDRWLWAEQVAVRDSSVALAGRDFAATAWETDDDMNYISSQNLWFGTFSGFNPAAADDLADVRIAEVRQTKPVKFLKVSANGSLAYHVWGGGFQMRVEQASGPALESVEVNTIYPRPFFIGGECGGELTEKKTFLMADSAWVDWGDIFLEYQPEVPTQFCFWTSAPNQRPDANHDNDAACVGIILDDEEPAPTAAAALQIFPNPANKWLTVQAGRTFSEKTRWEIFNATGQRVADGACPAGSEQLEIGVGDLPPGLFCLKIGGRGQVFQVLH